LQTHQQITATEKNMNQIEKMKNRNNTIKKFYTQEISYKQNLWSNKQKWESKSKSKTNCWYKRLNESNNKKLNVQKSGNKEWNKNLAIKYSTTNHKFQISSKSKSLLKNSNHQIMHQNGSNKNFKQKWVKRFSQQQQESHIHEQYKKTVSHKKV